MAAYFDETTGLPNDLRPLSAWVDDDGIGRCGVCTYSIAFGLNNGWDARVPAVKTLARYGFAKCDDEWCSDCDRTTVAS